MGVKKTNINHISTLDHPNNDVFVISIFPLLSFGCQNLQLGPTLTQRGVTAYILPPDPSRSRNFYCKETKSL